MVNTVQCRLNRCCSICYSHAGALVRSSTINSEDYSIYSAKSYYSIHTSDTARSAKAQKMKLKNFISSAVVVTLVQSMSAIRIVQHSDFHMLLNIRTDGVLGQQKLRISIISFMRFCYQFQRLEKCLLFCHYHSSYIHLVKIP